MREDLGWTREELESYKKWAAFMTKQADKAELELCYMILKTVENPQTKQQLQERLKQLEIDLEKGEY